MEVWESVKARLGKLAADLYPIDAADIRAALERVEMLEKGKMEGYIPAPVMWALRASGMPESVRDDTAISAWICALRQRVEEQRVLIETLEGRIKGLHVANDSFGDLAKRVEEQAGELAEARDMATQLVGREVSLRQRVEELERERDPERLEAWGRGLTQRAKAAEAKVARLTALLDVSERKLGEWRDRGAEVERLRAAAGRVIEAHDDRTIFAPIDALRAALRGGGE